MFSRSNIKQIKTTLLGCFIILASVAYPYFVEGSNAWIFGIMFCVGLAMLFLPDTLITSLKKFVTVNSDREV